jgi:hypothetical protein
MKRDILVISGGMLAVGLVGWTFWGNPDSGSIPRMHTVQPLQVDSNLKLISERSPSMRTER